MNLKKYTIESEFVTLSMERVFIYILAFDLMESSVIPFYVGQAVDPIRRFENHTRIAWHYGKFIRATKVYLAGSVHTSVANKAEQDMITRLSMSGYSLINIAISDAYAKKRQRAHDIESWTDKEIYEYSKQMPTLNELQVLQEWRDNWANKIIPTKTTKYAVKSRTKRAFTGNTLHPTLKALSSQPEDGGYNSKVINSSTSTVAPIFESSRNPSKIENQLPTLIIPAQISKRQLENYIKLNPPIYKKMIEYPKPAKNPDKNKLNGGSSGKKETVQRDIKYRILDHFIKTHYNEITGVSTISIPEPLVSIVCDYLLEPSTIWQNQNQTNTLAPLLAEQKITFKLKEIVIRNIKEFR